MRVEGDEARVNVAVEDNGIGIDPSLQSDIFDLFTQAERTPDRAQGGLGLGLALVKSLIELHGGQVAVHSEGAGKGSTFTVTLTRESGVKRQPEPSPSKMETPVTTGRAKVLVVDDNKDAADMLSLSLQELGHDISVAYDSLDALAVAARSSPAVLFVDIGLPRMNGYQLARRLRAAPQTADSLLVAVTGYRQPGDKERATHAGFDHHLVKPATPLETKVSRVLGAGLHNVWAGINFLRVRVQSHNEIITRPWSHRRLKYFTQAHLL